jgi:hypothetical protein
MQQSNYQSRKVVVSAAMLLAMISGSMRPALCEEFLQGGITHSEKLSPVEGFKIGSQFDQAKALASVAPTRAWYRVPPWLAGRWTADQYTETFDLNYETGSQNSTATVHNDKLTERWGAQRDRDGGMWDTIDLPFISTATSPRHLTKDLHTGDQLIFDSDVRVVLVYRATRTTIERATNTITKVQQFESFTTLTLGGPDTIKDEYSLKLFDQQGNPVEFVKGWRLEHKIEPFKVSDFDIHGQDLRPSFKQYLINQGLDNLVPGD